MFYTMIFVIGLINNNGYVLIGSSAQDMARKFKHKDLMPVFQFFLVCFSSFIRIINSRFLLKIKHRNKLITVVLMWTLGYILFFISYYIENDFGFALSLLATVLIGAFTSLGGCTSLGYMKTLPPLLVGAYGSGTGMAGISGAGIYLLVTTVFKIDFAQICLIMIPLGFIYLLCFFWVLRN